MAKAVDAVVVVGGRNSGNTQRLAQVVEQEGVPAFHVESEAELDCQAIEPLRSIGITAGASTPNWVIKKVLRTIEALPHQARGRWRHCEARRAEATSQCIVSHNEIASLRSQ